MQAAGIHPYVQSSSKGFRNNLKRKKTDEAEMVGTFANLQNGVWKGKKEVGQ